MVDRKKGRAAEDGSPTTPFAIQGPEEKSAKQVLFGKGSKSNGDNGVARFQARHFGQLFLRFLNQFRRVRDVVQDREIPERNQTEHQSPSKAGGRTSFLYPG